MQEEKMDDGTTLFLGDLSVYSTENHIRDLFQPYGKIENIRIKKGNSSKPHLCYGFIKFQTKQSAEKAMKECNGVLFLGRTLRY
jgi:RNA recognition motif-containing protein